MPGLVLEILRHPITQIIQIQACLVLCVGVVGWTLSGLRRRRELLRLQAAGHGAFLQQRAGMADSHPAAAGCAGQAPEGHCSSRQHESKAAVLQQRRSCCQPAAVSAASASASAQEAEAAGVAGGCTRAAPCSHDTQQQSCTPALFKSLRNADSNSSSTNSGSSSCPWPPLAVVLPVKGCRPHSTDNWASQLDALYDGPSVFVFVVESAADTAVAAVAGLMKQQGALCLLQQQHLQQQQGQSAGRLQPGAKQQQQQQPQMKQWPPGVLAVWQQQQLQPQQPQQQPQQLHAGRLVVVAEAGLASTCSQKIHNVLHGAEVGKALLHSWHKQQQKQEQQQQRHQEALPPKQPQQQRDAAASSVHILAIAGGGSSTDGSSAGNSSAGNSSSGSNYLLGDTPADVAPTADVAARPAGLPLPHTKAAHAAAAAEAGGVSAGSTMHNSLSPSVCSVSPASSALAASAAAAAAAAELAGAGYVCILDDDVLLHPLGLMQLVDELQADPTLFMATGYPFDIVAEPSSSDSSSSSSSFCGRLLSYATASYHLPLTIGFSIADRGNFVWGGAILLRAAALGERPPLHVWQQQDQQQQQQQPAERQQEEQPPPASILQVWREGGYSDDMVLAAYCINHGLAIALPPSALFPQLLPGATSWPQYWNYLRRQLFVLDTYYNEANRVANHTLMLLHSYGSAVFIIAVVASLLQLAALAAAAAVRGFCLLAGSLLPSGWGLLGELGWAAVDAAAWVCSSSGGSDASSVGEVVLRGASAQVATAGLYVFLACVGAAQLSIWFMSRQCLALMQELAGPPAGAGAGSRAGAAAGGGGVGPVGQQRPDRRALLQRARVSYALLWAGWVLENAVLPACMFQSFASDWISWGGIRYQKEYGRVVAVIHPTTTR